MVFLLQHIPNRTENVVKNHWNATARRVSRLMKRLRATPGALNSINFNSLEHYIMVTVCGGDPNVGVGHGPNAIVNPPASMPAFSQDLTRRMQVCDLDLLAKKAQSLRPSLTCDSG